MLVRAVNCMVDVVGEVYGYVSGTRSLGEYLSINIDDIGN